MFFISTLTSHVSPFLKLYLCCNNIKRKYEELVQKVEDATRNSCWLDAGDDFEAFSNTKPSDHSTIVKVFLQFIKFTKDLTISNNIYLHSKRLKSTWTRLDDVYFVNCFLSGLDQ